MQITEIPDWLAGAWSIDTAVAQLILSVIIISLVLLPVLYLARGKNATIIYLFTFFLTECFLVAVGWMPFWILLGTVALMAMGVAFLGSKVLGG